MESIENGYAKKYIWKFKIIKFRSGRQITMLRLSKEDIAILKDTRRAKEILRLIELFGMYILRILQARYNIFDYNAVLINKLNRFLYL